MRSNSVNDQRNMELLKKNVIDFLWLNTEFFQKLKEMSLFYNLNELNPFSLLFTRLKFSEDEELFKEFQLALVDLASAKLNFTDKMDILLSKHSYLTEVLSFFIKQNPPALLNKYFARFYDDDTLVNKRIIMKRNLRLVKYQQIVEMKLNVFEACQFLTAYVEFFRACIESTQLFITWVDADKSRQRAISAFSDALKDLMCSCPATRTYKLRPFLEAVDQLLIKPELMEDFLSLNHDVVNLILNGSNILLAYICMWYLDNPKANQEKQNRQKNNVNAVENIEDENKKSRVVLTHSTHFQPNKKFPPEDYSDPDANLGSTFLLPCKN